MSIGIENCTIVNSVRVLLMPLFRAEASSVLSPGKSCIEECLQMEVYVYHWVVLICKYVFV